MYIFFPLQRLLKLDRVQLSNVWASLSIRKSKYNLQHRQKLLYIGSGIIIQSVLPNCFIEMYFITLLFGTIKINFVSHEVKAFVGVCEISHITRCFQILIIGILNFIICKRHALLITSYLKLM